ncbi:MAG: GTP 3',8-cyclase MoaA [Anaerovoracaceae bacterium]
MIDTYGRRIHYARISITDLCNLRCQYCMPEEGVTKKDCGEILRIEDFVEISKALLELGIDKIRVSGGEPLVRHGMLTMMREIGKISGLKDFAVTTNGLLLPRYAKELRNAGVRRVNISLDTLDEERYRTITRGGDLKRALAGIDAARSVGFDRIKINVVLMKGFNDDEISRFVEFTRDNPIDVRFIELMPFEGQQEFAYGKYMSADAVPKLCNELREEPRDDPSSPARYYRLPGGKGLVGLIEPMSHTFCHKCNRIRITADGHILSCLHSRSEIDLKPALGDREAMKTLIMQAVSNKPMTHRLSQGELMERDMGQIGG